MNDHHLDPLDFAEGPECPLDCDGTGDFPRLAADESGDVLTCATCGHVWSVPREKADAAHRWELWAGMVLAYLSLGVWLAVVLLLLAYLAFGAALEGGAA